MMLRLGCFYGLRNQNLKALGHTILWSLFSFCMNCIFTYLEIAQTCPEVVSSKVSCNGLALSFMSVYGVFVASEEYIFKLVISVPVYIAIGIVLTILVTKITFWICMGMYQ
jgi:hypothetical protein